MDVLSDESLQPDGKLKTVHGFNAARFGYVLDVLAALSSRQGCPADSLRGLTVLDAGCSAGSRRGADRPRRSVAGIAAAGKSIDRPKAYSRAGPGGLSTHFQAQIRS